MEGGGPVIFHISSNEQQPIPIIQPTSPVEEMRQKITQHRADKDMQEMVKLFPQHSQEKIQTDIQKHQPLIGKERITLIKKLANLKDEDSQQAKKRADNRAKAQTKARLEAGGIDPIEEAHPQAEEAAALRHGKSKKNFLVNAKNKLKNIKKEKEGDFLKKEDKDSPPLKTAFPEKEKTTSPEKEKIERLHQLHRVSQQLDYLDRMPSSRDPKDPEITIKKTHARQKKLTDDKLNKLELALQEKAKIKANQKKFAAAEEATLKPKKLSLRSKD